ALVSGRPLRGLDHLFAPLRLPTAAGLHGLERRSAHRVQAAPEPPPAFASVHEEARRLAQRWPGAVVEDKGAALGLHWRGAPAAGDALRDFADAALPRLPGYRLQHGNQVVELRPAEGDKGAAIDALLEEPPFRGRLDRPWRCECAAGDSLRDSGEEALPRLHGYRLQHGNQVVELRPAECDKGAALDALLEEPPFRGRVPVFAGDDITDESGFAVVNRRGGLSVLVGDREPSAAHYRLRSPEAVRRWLAEGVAA